METEFVSNDDVYNGFDIIRTRLLLMFGGPFGFHLLYLHEPLEAYIYFATFGISLIAVFYDALTLNNRVAARNKEINIEDINSQRRKVISTSIIRFIAQFLFGCWIGFLFCLATVLLFGIRYRILLALCIAIGVAQGIYVVGNCRKQQRSLIYIALSAVLSSLTAVLLFDLSLFRTIFFTSVSATFVGNRSTQFRNIQKFSFWTYFVLSLIHSFIVFIILISLVRVVLDRRISVVSENSSSRISASLGSIIQDKYFRFPSKDIFENFTRIEYQPSQRITVLNTETIQTNHRIAQEELCIFDYITVLIIDFMRYSTVLSKNEEETRLSALQLAVWRTFTLHVLDITPYASDEKVRQECSKYLKNKEVIKEAVKNNNFWQHRAITKACELLHALENIGDELFIFMKIKSKRILFEKLYRSLFFINLGISDVLLLEYECHGLVTLCYRYPLEVSSYPLMNFGIAVPEISIADSDIPDDTITTLSTMAFLKL